MCNICVAMATESNHEMVKTIEYTKLIRTTFPEVQAEKALAGDTTGFLDHLYC